MPIKLTPVLLADRLCSVILLIRQFGETNSPYLTRLETEINTKGWRLGNKRADKIREELCHRQTQLEALMARMSEALTCFGPVHPDEKKILLTYWDEAARVRTLYETGSKFILQSVQR